MHVLCFLLYTSLQSQESLCHEEKEVFLIGLVFDFIRLGWLRNVKSEDMNKVIDTSTSVFMPRVRPSVSEKTELIFNFLMGSTF